VIKAAVIGAGNMGRQHIATLRALALEGLPIEDCVVSDNEIAALSRVAESFGITDTSPDWINTISRDDIDVVHICTPNSTHFAIAKAALLRGKHVICEKPLAVNAEECAELVALAAESGLTGAVCFTYRGYEAIERARRLCLDGALGDVHMVRGGFVQGWLASAMRWDWRIDPSLGGPSRAMADLGSHWLDLATFVTGESPIRLVADLQVIVRHRRRQLDDTRSSAQVHDADVAVTTEDYGSVMFQTDRFPGAFTVSQVSKGYENTFWLEVDGSEASLSWTSEEPTRLRLLPSNDAIDALPSISGHGNTEPAHEPAIQRILRSAYREIWNGLETSSQSVHANLADGLRSAQLVDAVLKSAATHQWISVPSNAPERYAFQSAGAASSANASGIPD
jgi:predicted dehydrogenase